MNLHTHCRATNENAWPGRDQRNDRPHKGQGDDFNPKDPSFCGVCRNQSVCCQGPDVAVRVDTPYDQQHKTRVSIQRHRSMVLNNDCRERDPGYVRLLNEDQFRRGRRELYATRLTYTPTRLRSSCHTVPSDLPVTTVTTDRPSDRVHNSRRETRNFSSARLFSKSVVRSDLAGPSRSVL